jgi:cation diffusion facilitator CzcD-associated flavoprotein CzcO
MYDHYPNHDQNPPVEPKSTRKVTRVGIIGAGASGLAQLKQLLEAFSRPEVKSRTELEVIVFEKQAEVGGVWYVDLPLIGTAN